MVWRRRGERVVHPAAGAALIAQRAMLGNRVPRIVRERPGKIHLRRGIEFLLGDAQRGRRNARRKLLGPEHAVVFERHQVRIGLKLQANIELDILFGTASPTMALRR